VAGRARRVELLRAARARMAPGAPILLSFFTRKPGEWHAAAVARVANAARRVRRLERVELGDAMDETYYHRFTEEEVRSELAEAGFEPLHFSHEPYGHTLARAR
jgi:hypothetical protein